MRREKSRKSKVGSQESRSTIHDSRFTALWVVCVCGLLLIGCSGGGQAAVPTFIAPTPKANSAAAPFLSRPTYAVTAATLTATIDMRGDLVAEQQAALFFPTAGTVKAVTVLPGQQVAAGAVLAELDAPTQEQTVLQRESSLTIAQLNLQKLEGGEPDDLDLAIAEENVALAEALYELAQQQQAATVLTAPFAGIVTMFNLQLGSRVAAYETVATIADLSEVEIHGMLLAEDYDQASIGQSAQVQIDGYGATTLTGTVTDIAAEAIAWQGGLAYAVVIALDADQALPSVAQVGADITLLGDTHIDVPWVPVNALITVGDATYLDILTETAVERIQVEVGVVDGQRVEIAGGVAAGDTVVLP